VSEWSEEICEYSPFCLRRHRTRKNEGLLLEVLDDYWDSDARVQVVKIKVVKTGQTVERPFSWVQENCEKLNEMEVLAWASK
jgi:hypothetical protein